MASRIMHYAIACEGNGNVNFEVYPYEDIMLFIEKVCEKCIYEINAIRENHPMGDSEELFVHL